MEALTGPIRFSKNTAAISRLIVHRHAENQGLGATARDGLRQAAAVASERDIVITMDAEESYTPGLMIRMIRMIREGYDVVIASRYQPGSRVYGLSMSRRIVSRAASLLMRVLFPTPGVSDYTWGLPRLPRRGSPTGLRSVWRYAGGPGRLPVHGGHLTQAPQIAADLWRSSAHSALRPETRPEQNAHYEDLRQYPGAAVEKKVRSR
jgi:hypothetical protein